MSRARVFEWNKQIQEGQMSLKDSSWSGQAHLVITPSVIAAVDAAVRNDIRQHLNSLYSIIEYIKFSRILIG